MISAGDELGRTQRGNNNAYCQDSELSWINWKLEKRQVAFLGFVRGVLRLRRRFRAFRRRVFLSGSPLSTTGIKEVMWLHPDGREFDVGDWEDSSLRVLGMLLHGCGGRDPVGDESEILAETLLLVLNGGELGLSFSLPAVSGTGPWIRRVSTVSNDMPDEVITTGTVEVPGRSILLLESTDER